MIKEDEPEDSQENIGRKIVFNMSDKRAHTLLKVASFIIILLIFCYFRAKPIYFQTVPYTYDQGRDFLKAEELMRFKNLTFIGPTTGIVGIFHGAWWYYFVALAYGLFHAWPLGFYYSVFCVMLVSTLLFSRFLYRAFGYWTAILFCSITAISPYFIRISFFPANNILAPVWVLLLIYASYTYINKQSRSSLFLIGLSLAFIFESEVPFGLFIIPSYIISALCIPPFWAVLKKPVCILFAVLGFIIPFIPRLLFEVKHNFTQFHTLTQFAAHPTATNPQSFAGVFIARRDMFMRFYAEMFYGGWHWLGYALLLIACLGYIMNGKKLPQAVRYTAIFTTLLTISLFGISLLYRNNFFWEYYLEGIHYLFLFIVLVGIYSFSRARMYQPVLIAVAVAYMVLVGWGFQHAIATEPKIPRPVGLRADWQTIDYLYSQVGKHEFCMRVYTPPVVPYTYDYLTHYKSYAQGYKNPSHDFTNGSCWYIIDPETYTFRITTWRHDNIPESSKRVSRHMMPNGVSVELWKLPTP